MGRKNIPPDNVAMILNYIEVRMNRIAGISLFEPLKRGDLKRMDQGLKKVIRRFAKKMKENGHV